jgi:hypothetical protein
VIIHTFTCYYRKQLILKTIATRNGRTSPTGCKDEAGLLSAICLIAEPWRLITLTAIRNCFVRCGFSVDHASSSDSAVKLCEDEEDDWHSLQPLGVQSEDYPTCANDLRVCGVQSVDQVLDQQLTRLEEEEKVAEHKATFFDALKGLEAARKCIDQFDTKNNIIVMCSKVESKLYRLKVQAEKQKTDWLQK